MDKKVTLPGNCWKRAFLASYLLGEAWRGSFLLSGILWHRVTPMMLVSLFDWSELRDSLFQDLMLRVSNQAGTRSAHG